MRYWIGIASRDHVQSGIAGGFAQLCHGKAIALKRMQPGDWLLYYSPRLQFTEKTKYQAFTAIAQVIDPTLYRVAMNPQFSPWRRAVQYFPSRDTPIKPLLDRLAFVGNQRHWGYSLRRGHFQIPRSDFEVIAAAMVVDVNALTLEEEVLETEEDECVGEVAYPTGRDLRLRLHPP